MTLCTLLNLLVKDSLSIIGNVIEKVMLAKAEDKFNVKARFS